jgi:hypothetical protein
MTMLDSAAPFREPDRRGHSAAFEQAGLFVEQLRTFLRQDPGTRESDRGVHRREAADSSRLCLYTNRRRSS